MTEEMTKKEKKWIDDATYEQLLSRWRNAPIGASIFSGQSGMYYSRTMDQKKIAVGHDEAVATSKRIGHDGPDKI
jgi:hypothetical protein